MPPEPFPGLPEVTVERDVAARMRDGVTLRADVYRPAGDGPRPVLLMREPVRQEHAPRPARATAHPSWWARQG